MIKLKRYRERSFSYAAPVEWNKLDVEIRSLSNLETFKKKLQNYLFNIAYTKDCMSYFIMLDTVYISVLHYVVVIIVFIKFICVRDFKLAVLL